MRHPFRARDFTSIEKTLGEIADDLVPHVGIASTESADAMTTLAGEGWKRGRGDGGRKKRRRGDGEKRRRGDEGKRGRGDGGKRGSGDGGKRGSGFSRLFPRQLTTDN
jgi:hypothetical protein